MYSSGVTRDVLVIAAIVMSRAVLIITSYYL